MTTYIPFLLFLLAAAASARSLHPNIIQSTCKKCAESDPNVNYTLCLNLFDSVPKSHNSSLRGLAIIATKLSLKNATKIQSEIKDLVDTPQKSSSGGLYASCLDTCLDLYSDAASGLNDSVGAIRKRRYDDANVWISAALDAGSECEDGFADEGMESPLTEENEEYFGMVAVALSIVAMLQGRVH